MSLKLVTVWIVMIGIAAAKHGRSHGLFSVGFDSPVLASSSVSLVLWRHHEVAGTSSVVEVIVVVMVVVVFLRIIVAGLRM